MTELLRGFYLDRIAVTGSGMPTAELEFRDGLNVVEGASDTGKSYLCSLVDFIFGASKPPRDIEAAKGYSRVVGRLRERRSGCQYEIERALSGGDALVRRMNGHGLVLDQTTAAAKHSAEDETSLSALLLGLSDFGPARVRKNKKGETRTLSFRDIAFLVVVDETRIISENPAHLSGSPVERTVEGDVFRFVVSGVQSTGAMVAPSKATLQSAKAQLELVQRWIAQVEGEVAALQLGALPPEEELKQLDEMRADLLRAYETSRVQLVELESVLAARSRDLRDAESRLVVIEGLIRRFELLARHYESDMERLAAVEETGSMLATLPTSACPVCGAAPEDHRPEEAAEHFRAGDVREAARSEQEKIGRLRTDLQRTLYELSRDAETQSVTRLLVQAEAQALQEQIAGEVQPRVRTSIEKLQTQNDRRDALLRGRVLTDQLRELRLRAEELEAPGKRDKGRGTSGATGPTTAGVDAFALGVQEILREWHFPETGRVVFSEDSQDLVVGGQPRVSHGKGVRALSCSAFIAGVMRHCLQRGLPHPGLIVLDSPLVAYKDPDSSAGADSTLIRQAGVKEAFYRALADGFCLGQVIVLENEAPPSDVADRVSHYHFTKGASGRYGLFPLA